MNYNFVIFPSNNIVIIQVNKPLLGNVLNVTIDKFNGISTSPAPDFIKELIESLDSADLVIAAYKRSVPTATAVGNLKNNTIYFECLYEKKGSILIKIKAGSDSVKGVISTYG